MIQTTLILIEIPGTPIGQQWPIVRDTAMPFSRSYHTPGVVHFVIEVPEVVPAPEVYRWRRCVSSILSDSGADLASPRSDLDFLIHATLLEDRGPVTRERMLGWFWKFDLTPDEV